MKRHALIRSLVLLLAAFMWSCQEQGSVPVASDTAEGLATLEKKGGTPGPPDGGGDDKVVFDVEAVWHGGPYAAPTLVSTCLGSTDGKGLSVTWPRHAGCMDITPLGGYLLTDDPNLLVTTKKGKIISVQFWIQDVIGREGVQHKSEEISVDPSVEPSSSGFILHIHQDNVPVYRLKGHTGGPIVEEIGTISVGDFVYTPK